MSGAWCGGDAGTFLRYGAGEPQLVCCIHLCRHMWVVSPNGTGVIWRHSSYSLLGGCSHRLQLHPTGVYSVPYLPVCLAMGTCPSEPRGFFVQQYRWCMGSTTLLLNKEFWHSRLTFMQKQCYLSGMFYYSATAIGIFVGPIPGLLLIWIKPSAVFWYIVSFAVPSIAFSVIAMRLWSKQKYDSACNRVKVLQYFAHLFAIKDKLMGTAIPWIPTGGGAASRSSSSAYDSAMKLMVIWVTLHTAFVIAGTAWRYTQFPWYHFLPTLVLALGNYVQSISILF
ncbi:unnamed protein product [Choristocarpus tenellus]